MTSSADAFKAASGLRQAGRRRKRKTPCGRLLAADPRACAGAAPAGPDGLRGGAPRRRRGLVRQRPPTRRRPPPCTPPAWGPPSRPPAGRRRPRRNTAAPWRLKPGDGMALNNLGVTLAALGRPRARRRPPCAAPWRPTPNDAEAWCNLGAALHAQGKLDEAEAACRRALELAPDLAQAHTNLGNVVRDRGRPDEAEACHRRAVELQPAPAGGVAEPRRPAARRGRPPEAVPGPRHGAGAVAAATRGPRPAGRRPAGTQPAGRGRRRLPGGPALRPGRRRRPQRPGQRPGRAGPAGRGGGGYREAARLRPDWSAPVYNRGVAVQGQGRLARGPRRLRGGAAARPVRPRRPRHVRRLPAFRPRRRRRTAARRGPPLGRGPRPVAPRPGHAPQHAGPLPASACRLRLAGLPLPRRRLLPGARAGPARPGRRGGLLLRRRGRARRDDGRVARPSATPGAVTWGLTDDEVEAQVRQDGIDVLVDLGGHLAHNRLRVFARRPAPVQLSWLGYAAGTGVPAIDFRLTDAVCDPPGEAAAGRGRAGAAARPLLLLRPAAARPAADRTSRPTRPAAWSSARCTSWRSSTTASWTCGRKSSATPPTRACCCAATRCKGRRPTSGANGSRARARGRPRGAAARRPGRPAAPAGLRRHRRGPRLLSVERAHDGLRGPVDGRARRHAARPDLRRPHGRLRAGGRRADRSWSRKRRTTTVRIARSWRGTPPGGGSCARRCGCGCCGRPCATRPPSRGGWKRPTARRGGPGARSEWSGVHFLKGHVDGSQVPVWVRRRPTGPRATGAARARAASAWPSTPAATPTCASAPATPGRTSRPGCRPAGGPTPSSSTSPTPASPTACGRPPSPSSAWRPTGTCSGTATATPCPAGERVLTDAPGVKVMRRRGWDARPGRQPLRAGAGLARPAAATAPRDIDVLFVGNLNAAVQRERPPWLARLARPGRPPPVAIRTGVWGDAYRDLLRRARIVFNRGVRGECNRRAFEAACCGALLFQERGNAETAAFFRDREECVCYGDGRPGRLCWSIT